MKTKLNFKELLSKVKIEYLVVCALGILALFIFFSSFNQSSETKLQSVDGYVGNLENKLTSTLSKVKGAGKVKVIISIESGMQTVYATATEKSDQIISQQPVIVNGKTLVLREEYPKVVGVVIVSQGANNLTCKMALLNATCVFLNVPESKVEILAMT